MVSPFTFNSLCIYYPILENRSHVNYIFCIFFVLFFVFYFSILIGLVDAAVDAAPGSGVFTQLHGQSLDVKLTTPKIG